jgi:hypothetical protein
LGSWRQDLDTKADIEKLNWDTTSTSRPATSSQGTNPDRSKFSMHRVVALGVELATELSAESEDNILELGVGECSALDDGVADADRVELTEIDSIGGKQVFSYSSPSGTAWNSVTPENGTRY